MNKITYKDIFNKLINKFDISIVFENISENKLMLKFKSKKYKYIWFDVDEFGKEKYDNLYIKYNKTENVEELIYDIFFDHIKTYEKYYLMVSDKTSDKLLLQIPPFDTIEELAIKLEMLSI